MATPRNYRGHPISDEMQHRLQRVADAAIAGEYGPRVGTSEEPRMDLSISKLRHKMTGELHTLLCVFIALPDGASMLYPYARMFEENEQTADIYFPPEVPGAKATALDAEKATDDILSRVFKNHKREED